VVFCVFNWHELLRAQMDDWTANILCVLFARYLSLEKRLPKQNQKQQQSTQAKKRDFSITLVFGALGTAKRTLVPKQNKTKQKQHKNTSKHERYENSSLIDIPDDEDAFFERT